jgi:hypothetical protein
MERVKLGGFEATILDPRIIVFHNAVKDPDGLIDHYEKNLPWRGWFAFGRQVDQLGPSIMENPEFPTWEQWKSSMIDTMTDPIRNHVAEVFYRTSEEYYKYTGTTFPNWTCKNWSLARYLPDENVINNDELTMNYHTDYQHSKHDQPGEKFATTAVIYPNDDYEGGEISFRVANSNWEIEKQIDYKPVKGDIVFFPAEHPYYHGVKRVSGAAKYIIRLYWQYTSEGTEEWHKLHEKYGDSFRELEQQRIDRHDLMMAIPFLRPRFTITEYYEKLEDGTLPDPHEHDN